MNRRGFLRSIAALVATAAVAPAVLLKFPPLPRGRKLRSVWVCERASDLNALHGIDVENELMALMSKQIVQDIDRTIIADMLG